MLSTNYQRLIELAEKTFNLKNDSSQLHIGYNEIKTLRSIHVHTVNEYAINNEPVAWLTIIPSNEQFMRLFLDDKLNEKELYNCSIKLIVSSILNCNKINKYIFPIFKQRNGI